MHKKYSILYLLFNYGEKRNISLFSPILFNVNLYFWKQFDASQTSLKL